MTPKQAAAFVALKTRIMDYAKANLPALDIKRKIGNFTGGFPVNLLLEADSTYIRIYPQGYAAIASSAGSMKGVNLIADIGNGTMNVLFITNGKPLSGKMFTEKFGTYQCTLAIREAFMRQTQRELNDAIIDEILCTGTADIAEDDLAIIRTTAEAYVADIFRYERLPQFDLRITVLL